MTAKLKPLNKHFCVRDDGQRRVVPNPFELCKQRCLMEAGRVVVDLPYFPYAPYEYEESHPDLFHWLDALSRKNPPYDRRYKVDPKRFRELVEPLDFSKPFDRAAVEAIWAEFRAAETPPAAAPDAEDIAVEEMGG